MLFSGQVTPSLPKVKGQPRLLRKSATLPILRIDKQENRHAEESMDLTSFFAAAADTLLNRYRSLAGYDPHQPPPAADRQANATARRPFIQPDRYLPANTPGSYPTEKPTEQARPAETPRQDSVEIKPRSSEPTAEPTSPNVNPDGTYYFAQKSQLNYRLDLQFDMRAVTSTVAALAEGDTAAIQQYAAAGFGFRADLAFDAAQITKTNMEQPEQTVRRNTMSLLRSGKANLFEMVSRDFRARGFARDSLRVQNMLQENQQDVFRHTVSRFSLRYRMDTSFNFSFLQRLNIQTEQVAQQQPQVVGSYLQSAGNVAEKGTAGMMAGFFDAVDAYLNNAEEQLVDKVNAFFDMAVEEMGFSEQMVNIARGQMLGSIESFFGRVDSAMNLMQARFVPVGQLPAEQPALPVQPVEPPTVPLDPNQAAHSTNRAELEAMA
jgi:hypothetical protein